MAPSRSDMLRLLSALPGSYAGPDRPETGPFAVVGVGEGTLAAHLLTSLIGTNFARTGTQFVLSSADAQDAARTYAELAEVAGATVRRVSTGGQPDDVDVLIPAGAFATYHYAQFVAHASGRSELEIELKYFDGEPVIREIERVSKPGRRVYVAVRNLPRINNGLGVAILSTPKGVMADHAAREANVGGEIICTVF